MIAFVTPIVIRGLGRFKVKVFALIVPERATAAPTATSFPSRNCTKNFEVETVLKFGTVIVTEFIPHLNWDGVRVNPELQTGEAVMPDCVAMRVLLASSPWNRDRAKLTPTADHVIDSDTLRVSATVMSWEGRGFPPISVSRRTNPGIAAEPEA